MRFWRFPGWNRRVARETTDPLRHATVLCPDEIDAEAILSTLKKIARLNRPVLNVRTGGTVVRDGVRCNRLVLEPVLPIGSRTRLDCTERSGVLHVQVSDLDGPHSHVTMILGRIREGLTHPTDADDMTANLKQSFAMLGSAIRRIDGRGDPMSGRIMLHWLGEVTTCASLQAGGVPEGRRRCRRP